MRVPGYDVVHARGYTTITRGPLRWVFDRRAPLAEHDRRLLEALLAARQKELDAFYRPSLSSHPHLDYIQWYQPADERSLDAYVQSGAPLPRGVVRGEHVQRWVCPCGATGRMWKGEPPERSRIVVDNKPPRHNPGRAIGPGCPCCGRAWENAAK